MATWGHLTTKLSKNFIEMFVGSTKQQELSIFNYAANQVGKSIGNFIGNKYL